MEPEKKIKLLQMFYAGALADNVLRLEKEGILEKVAEQKRQEQLLGGKTRAAQLGMQQPRQVFEVLPELFGCADWAAEDTDDGFQAKATRCMLCALCKKMGTASPCHIYCLDAMEGMVKGLDEAASYDVVSTLWDQDQCQVIIATKR